MLLSIIACVIGSQLTELLALLLKTGANLLKLVLLVWKML